MVAVTFVVGTKEPFVEVVFYSVSGLAVVEPLMKDCLDAEGSSAQPAKKAVTEMSNAIFFITVVLTFAEFDLKQKLTLQ